MNKTMITAMVAIATVATAAACTSHNQNSNTSKTTVIETTDLCQVKGYRGTTPVRVTIVDGVVMAVEALPNRETPRFFQRVADNLLPKYRGVKVKKAIEMTSDPAPDGCTGATYSTRAVQQNIKSALDKYSKK